MIAGRTTDVPGRTRSRLLISGQAGLSTCRPSPTSTASFLITALREAVSDTSRARSCWHDAHTLIHARAARRARARPRARTPTLIEDKSTTLSSSRLVRQQSRTRTKTIKTRFRRRSIDRSTTGRDAAPLLKSNREKGPCTITRRTVRDYLLYTITVRETYVTATYVLLGVHMSRVTAHLANKSLATPRYQAFRAARGRCAVLRIRTAPGPGSGGERCRAAHR